MSLAARATTFADVRMRSLRRSHVEHWVKSMVACGLAPGTVHTRTNNVRAVLRGAVADRVIPRDPSEGIALPRRRRAAAAMTLPTPAQGSDPRGRRRALPRLRRAVRLRRPAPG